MKATDYVATMITAASDHTGIEERAILSKRSTMELCEVRWACWVVLYDKGWSLQRIGRAFNRHHGTIIHGLLRAKDDHGRRDPNFRELCRVVRDSIENANVDAPAQAKTP